MKLILRCILVAAIATSTGSVLLVRAQAQGDAQGPAIMSQRARNQIRALMQEKASRSHGRRKIDSQLIYSIKMHRGERIAEGVDSLLVTIPRTAAGAAIVDITANVGPAFLQRLRQAGAKILGAYPQSRSVRAEIDLNALDTIAEFPEIYYIQPMQEAITGQGTTSQGPGAPVDPEHLRTTRPEFDERESSLSAEIALMLEEFQTGAYNVGIGGVRKSEADLTHRAAAARNTYGSDGTGIKIGVLSDGVRNLAAVQASGDLGPVTVLPGQSGTSPGQCAANGSCDEGTAMLEIIHDIAPGAQLYFATAFGGLANFANNIRALRAAGCDIIVDDVFYFAESPFQDGQAPGVISQFNGGVIVQAVNDVTADGALYFSSAGNSGNKSDNTSGVWEGDFVDGGDAPAILGGAAAGRVHQFPGGLTFDVVTAAGSSQYNLNWSDPLGGSSNDYDLYALNAAGTGVITASTGSQDGTQDPFEAIGVTGVNTRLVIVKFSGDARYLRLTTNRGRLSVNTPGQTTGHSTAANAFGVAATPVATPGTVGGPTGPFPNPFTAANNVETFSSDGPRKLFFQADGTPFTPGNLLASGGISRQKPDITAADGVSVTGAGGFGIQFFGTSAAAPHAAAMAGLLKAANPSLTPAMVRDALQNTALDNEAGGVDRDAGYGIIMADSSLASIGASPNAANVNLGTPTVSEVGGNANGFLDPGERGTLTLPLLNTGVASASGVVATLSSTTPGVTITPSSTRSYPDIAATNGTSAAAPFEFVLQESAVYAAAIDFVMSTTYNGVTRSFPFIVPTGQLANISTVLDTNAPAAAPPGVSYTAATGLQTSRMNFTFPISGCAGAAKPNPGAFASALTRRYDAYTFTNPSASPICVTVLLTHSATALLYVDAYLTAFNPASVATNFAGDNGGSTTSGAGTTQLFSFNVAPGQTFVVVVSESNSGGAQNVPYNLRVSGLPAAAVPANVAPVNAVPGAQNVLEDGALVLSGASAISVSDADAGNNPVEVTVAAAGGVVSLGGTAGLTFTSGTGSGDASMTFTGSIAAINSALDGTTYAPAANFNGAASITVTTNDQGNTGTGGAMSDIDAVPITVTAVNDAPSFVAGANQTVAEDAGPQTVPNWATVSAGPADESGQTLTFLATGDNMALFSVQPAVAPDGTLTFTPAADANGTATVTLVLMDNGGTSDGGVDTSTTASFTITVTSVNDAPSFTAGASQTVAEDAGPRTVPAWATGIGAGPADESGQTVNFAVTNDNNALFSVQPAVAADGTLTFTSAPDAAGQAVVTLVLKDDGGTDGGGADASAPQTFTISVTPVNDAPSFTAGANQTVAEGAGLRTVPAWATNITAGPTNESGQTLAFIVTSNNPALFSVQPAVAPDGTLTFQPASNISGQAILTVVLKDNGGTGGGGLDTSAATGATLTVLNPAPRVDSLEPASAAVGGPDVWVDLIGDGFVPQSIVKLGTTAIESEFVSRTALRALVPATALAAAGVDYLTVVNGAPGGGASGPAAFFVNDTGAPVDSSDTATTDNGTATVVAGGAEPGTPGSVAAVATGTGTITVAQYDGNPSEPTGFAVSGGYFDVFVAPASTLTTLAVTTCNLNGGTSLLWHNGADWVPVQPQTLDTTRNCITATLDATSSPTIAQLTGTYFAVVIPTPPNVNTPGAMHGSGFIKVGTTWNWFDFSAHEKVSGLERGRLRFDARTPSTGRGRKRVPAVEHRFVSTSVTRVTFTDDPSSKPGKKAKPDVDSVVFSGAGCYDGRPGYTFDVRAVDRGEPGRQRDEFRIVIRNAAGAIVFTLDETIDWGNIQSTRLGRRR